jgi:hypothetical protein
VPTSHTLAVRSNDPVTTRSPKGLFHAIAYTTFLWPSRDATSLPVAVSQIWAVWRGGGGGEVAMHPPRWQRLCALHVG